ncbi:CLUMA_CG005551, isoform A [Clunio marinus]|uniref:CLUMA_CG005551, isoform A n=1 Tax=Clunio marinus TaxID=568069 RepID=A0A1J1HV86_9DIPT|nr:CLUMA_CG005551, isoform A [Clunio marinus]
MTFLSAFFLPHSLPEDVIHQKTALKVKYTKTKINNLLMKIDYPFGKHQERGKCNEDYLIPYLPKNITKDQETNPNITNRQETKPKKRKFLKPKLKVEYTKDKKYVIMIANGHHFGKYLENGDRSYWRCKFKGELKCPATLIKIGNEVGASKPIKHNHPVIPENNKYLECQKIAKQIKKLKKLNSLKLKFNKNKN